MKRFLILLLLLSLLLCSCSKAVKLEDATELSLEQIVNDVDKFALFYEQGDDEEKINVYLFCEGDDENAYLYTYSANAGYNDFVKGEPLKVESVGKRAVSASDFSELVSRIDLLQYKNDMDFERLKGLEPNDKWC